MLLHIEYDSNHGTSQGIWPRFYLQMVDLGELAIGQEFHDRIKVYFEKVIPDLTNLYDIYHKLCNTITEYKEGVKNGKYFKVDNRGHSSFDRLSEVEIYNQTKDFIIRTKIVIVNFIKSGFADENSFKLSDFFFCPLAKLQEKKNQYLKSADCKYVPLIKLIEKANKEFLTQLNEIRGSIEHDLFSLAKFSLVREGSTATITEPNLQDLLLSEKLTFYYDKTLEFIEKLMVYYIGINGEINKNGFLELHVDEVHDYAEMKYKYTFSLAGTPWSLTSKKCNYD